MKKLRLWAAVVLALAAVNAGAQDSGAPPDPSQTPPGLAAVAARLKPLHGTIIGASVTLDMPSDLGYLPDEQTDILLHQVLRYPGKIASLGSIIPTTVGIGSPAFWATLITYREDGHISDDGAQALLDPTAVLDRLEAENGARNANLEKHGFSVLGTEIVGWVKPPHYDSATHVLTWALEFAPHDGKEHQFSFNVRILGRIGVISMTLSGKLEQLPMLEKATEEIARIVRLNPPNRYEDSSWMDKSADYTVADIVAGNMHPRNLSANSSDIGKYLLSALFLLAVVGLYRFQKKRRQQPQ